MNAIISTTKQALLCGALFCAGSLLWAEPVTPAPSVSKSDSLAEILPVLQAKYANFDLLHYKDGDSLSELIARSKGEISLISESDSKTPTIATAVLPDSMLYWRLSSFTPKTGWDDLTKQLQKAAFEYPSGGAILDLRSSSAPTDIVGASQIMNFFIPEDKTLTKFRPSVPADGMADGIVIPEISFHGPLVVLVNHQTTGAAEVLAACLQADGALIIGRATPGRGAVLDEVKLPSGKVLRFVTAHVTLPNGTDLWDHPVIPDISLNADESAEKNALAMIDQGSVLDVIAEAAQRHRMSEASLVHGEDPELTDYLASRKKKIEPKPAITPTVQDIALVDALDSLKAIRLSQRPVPPVASSDKSTPTPATIQ